MVLSTTRQKANTWGGWDLPSRQTSGKSTRRTGLSTAGALGRPKPAVVGTGRVDGIPVYGLSKVVTTKYEGYCRFRHGGNPVLRWCFENVSVEVDKAGNKSMHKGKSRDRIDGAVAAAMAVGRASVGESTGPLTLEQITGRGDGKLMFLGGA